MNPQFRPGPAIPRDLPAPPARESCRRYPTLIRWRRVWGLFLLVSGALPPTARAVEPLLFDGEKAYNLLIRQCEFGPRVPGSGAHDRAGDFLAARFKEAGWEPVEQTFTGRPGLLQNRPVLFRNIIAARPVAGRPALIVTAHWDSRPVADKDHDSILAREPIPGANDGASGTALVLELARVFQERPTSGGLVLALVDGEDLGSTANRFEWCLGSKYLADRLDVGWNVRAAVNADMIGDKSLQFTRELYGLQAAKEFNEFCWKAGEELAPAAFAGTDRRMVYDDHVPFLKAGIPAFNLIDLKYSPWHTQSDTPDKCSAESLRISGRVVESIARRLGAMERWDFEVGALPADLSRW